MQAAGPMLFSTKCNGITNEEGQCSPPRIVELKENNGVHHRFLRGNPNDINWHHVCGSGRRISTVYT